MAVEFAYQGKLRGQVPVLFVMEVDYDDGKDKAFLHDDTFSAHPEEKEFLLGFQIWEVKEIETEVVDHRAGPLEVTVIYLDPSS